ncbi:hypothetical protein, partial [Pseudomonas viridiflava]|uniref:hypothetical protein n=1 Tax=Pseudomonas viridiflava TaxID=33069 RepID=UPI00197FA4F3
YIDLVFRCRYESGEPYPAGGENSEARRFPLDALPVEVSQNFRTRIALAASDTPEAHFVR